MKKFRNLISLIVLFTISINVTAQLSGTYTIGNSTSANYSTFTAAMNDLNNGITGPVIFYVEAGSYAERVVVPNVSGTSEINTILFTSLSGNNNDVIIRGTAYGGTDVAIFKVNGADYVTVENISFIPTSQSNAYNVHITNMSYHFTLRNCILIADLTTDIYGIRQVYTQAQNVEGQNNDYITVENCTITGGYIGLYIGGTSYVALTKEEGAILRNNVLREQGSKGIYIFDEKDALIENNIISSANTTKNDYQAIDIFRGIGNLIIRNNKINISQSVYSKGIYIRTDATGTESVPILVYNNSVSIVNAPSTSTYGICITSDCRYISFYYNSINIEGDAGRCFGVTSNYSDITNMVFQNNLFQNRTASEIFFFVNQQHYEAFTFSNNAYYLTGNKFTNSWGDDFQTWVQNSGEENSFIEEAMFNSSSDLHLQEAGNLQAALPISFITTDLDGISRNASTPTIGAYEFESSILLPPQMLDGYPQLVSCTDDQAQIKVKLDQSCTLYYLLNETGVDPTIEDVLVSPTYSQIDQMTESIITFSDLTSQQTYYLYFVAKNAQNLNSGLIICEPFTTLVQIFPLELSLPTQYGPVDPGTNVNIVPVISGGVTPYFYTWKDKYGNVIGNESTLSVQPMSTSTYSFTVTDSENTWLTKETVVLVNSDHEIATFDDLYLEPERAWYGSETGQQDNIFYSGSYSFTNTYIASWYAWGGFAYSNMTEIFFDPDEWFEHQFRSVTGSGANNTDNFAVVYPYGFQTQITVMHNDEGDVISGLYITNAAYTQNSIMNGDSYIGDPFKQGDYYKIMFITDDSKGENDTVEYFLADYRSINPDEHYSLSEWQWIDLSSLGQVNKIKISVDASRKDQYGLSLPTYLCIDEVGSPQPINIEYAWNIQLQMENSLNLRDLLSFEENVYIDYEILVSNNNLYLANIEEDDLIVMSNQDLSGEELLIKAYQKGLYKFIQIKITTFTGINNIKDNQITIYPIPAQDVLNINYDADFFQIQISNLSGKVIIQKECIKGESIVLDKLSPGIYFIKIFKEREKIAVEKFIKE